MALVAATWAAIDLPAGRVSAQQEGEDLQSTPIGMVAEDYTNETIQRTSQFGIMAPIGLRRNQQTAITLSVPSSWADSPVGIAPLDGGQIISTETLHVGTDGTVNFVFMGADSPGLYRLSVLVGSKRYQLQLYVGKDPDLCQ